MNAIIPIEAGRYFLFIAYVYGYQQRDWLATAWRDSVSEPWTVTYRFRYYGPDPSPWSGEDEKNIFEMKIPADDVTEDRLAESFKAVARALVSEGFNDRLDWIDVRTDDPTRVIDLLSARPWAHVKRLRAGEEHKAYETPLGHSAIFRTKPGQS